MYSDADLQSAVEAGVLPASAADALRRFVTDRQGLPRADEEQFRLLTGFNDVFVTIACALVIFAAAGTGGALAPALGGGLVAVASWGMAEVFTRRRRMALPSIVLLLAFLAGVGFAVAALIGQVVPEQAWVRSGGGLPPRIDDAAVEYNKWRAALCGLGGSIAAAGAALVHWRRFRVAITIAAGTGAAVLVLLATIAVLSGQSLADGPLITPIALLCGVACFAFAMRWDMSDPLRRTQRADVAFWLHLLAAPLIAHPLFHWIGVTDGASIGPAAVVGVLAIYLVFALIALAIDRRALLVSALAYVLIALGSLFRTYGSVQLNTALTALVIGSALLTLSAWWSTIRGGLIARLTPELARRLPPAG